MKNLLKLRRLADIHVFISLGSFKIILVYSYLLLLDNKYNEI